MEESAEPFHDVFEVLSCLEVAIQPFRGLLGCAVVYWLRGGALPPILLYPVEQATDLLRTRAPQVEQPQL